MWNDVLYYYPKKIKLNCKEINCMPVRFGHGLPKAVKSLLIANAVIHVVIIFSGAGVLISIFGLVPYLVNHKFMIWQFFTYMFLHDPIRISHILFNMFALWMFGAELEHNWGSRDFMGYYITCGIGGGLLVWFTAFFGMSISIVPTIGASGAIFGLLVAYAMMWPDRLIFIWGIIPMKALHLVLLFGAIDLLNGFGGGGGGIAYFAHIGGGVTGFIYLKYGWRIIIHMESFMKGFKRRKFTVFDGGSQQRRDSEDHDDTSHPDIDDEIDRILDKIAREGMESLSGRERKILDRASKRKRR